MHGAFALRTEILSGFDDPVSEILLPDAVNSYARRQRIIFAGEPLRETQAVRCGPCRERRESSRNIRIDLLRIAQKGPAGTNESMRALDSRALRHHECGGNLEFP